MGAITSTMNNSPEDENDEVSDRCHSGYSTTQSLHPFTRSLSGSLSISSFSRSDSISGNIKPKFNSGVARACKRSWDKIVNQQTTETCDGLMMICIRFFDRFHAEDSQVCDLFQPRTRSQHLGLVRCEMLVRMINFILSLQDDSFATKKIIRKIGRSHALAHIGRKEITIFNNVLLAIIASALENQLSSASSTSAWSILLEFVADEMCADNVALIAHDGSLDNNDNSTVAVCIQQEAVIESPNRILAEVTSV